MKLSFVKLHLIVLFLLISISSCEVINTTDDLVLDLRQPSSYVINKGEQHSTNAGLNKLSTDILRFEAKFDSTAVYQTQSPENQADINKLFGMSDCSTHHHANSARMGWRWYNNQLEIHAYTYNNKQRVYKYITAIPLDKTIVYTISMGEQEYIFSVNDIEVALPRYCSGKAEGYMLYPYFGGDEAAPHNINIYLKLLK